MLSRRAAEELDHAERAALHHQREGEGGMKADVGGVSDAIGAAHGGDVVDPHRPALGPRAARDAGADGEGGGARGGLEGVGVDALCMPYRGADEAVVCAIDRPERAHAPAEAVGERGEDLGGGGVDVLGGEERGLGLECGKHGDLLGDGYDCGSGRGGRLDRLDRRGERVRLEGVWCGFGEGALLRLLAAFGGFGRLGHSRFIVSRGGKLSGVEVRSGR